MVESFAAYKDILVLTKMQIRMAMWDVPLPIRLPKMTPVGTLIGNLYCGISGSPIADRNADEYVLALIKLFIWMSYCT